jgi:hypothetical protein
LLTFFKFRHQSDAQRCKDIQGVGLWALARLNTAVHTGPGEIINTSHFCTLSDAKPSAQGVFRWNLIKRDGANQSASLNFLQRFLPNLITNVSITKPSKLCCKTIAFSASYVTQLVQTN